MRKIFLLILIIMTITPAIASEYIVKEADQSLAGYYKQKTEFEKWKDNQLQNAISDRDSAKAYEEGIKEYQKALKRQQAMAAFGAALNNAALGVATQAQQMQALQYQQSKQISNYTKQVNYVPKNYSSTNYYNNIPKSNNGYPILDPYAARFK